jgi:hypothetical protein
MSRISQRSQPTTMAILFTTFSDCSSVATLIIVVWMVRVNLLEMLGNRVIEYLIQLRPTTWSEATHTATHHIAT